MRPVKGVVQRGMTIRLENGMSLPAPKDRRMKIGRTVFLTYDMTKSKILKIIRVLSEDEEHAEELPTEEHGPGIIDEIVEKDDSGSGALKPVGDWCGEPVPNDWEDKDTGVIEDLRSGSGVLSLECDEGSLAWCE